MKNLSQKIETVITCNIFAIVRSLSNTISRPPIAQIILIIL